MPPGQKRVPPGPSFVSACPASSRREPHHLAVDLHGGMRERRGGMQRGKGAEIVQADLRRNPVREPLEPEDHTVDLRPIEARRRFLFAKDAQSPSLEAHQHGPVCSTAGRVAELHRERFPFAIALHPESDRSKAAQIQGPGKAADRGAPSAPRAGVLAANTAQRLPTRGVSADGLKRISTPSRDAPASPSVTPAPPAPKNRSSRLCALRRYGVVSSKLSMVCVPG